MERDKETLEVHLPPPSGLSAVREHNRTPAAGPTLQRFSIPSSPSLGIAPDRRSKKTPVNSPPISMSLDLSALDLAPLRSRVNELRRYL